MSGEIRYHVIRGNVVLPNLFTLGSIHTNMALAADNNTKEKGRLWLPDSNRAKKSAKASSLLDTSINPLKT